MIFLVHCTSKNDITLRCSQPWLVGVLGGPVVPAHQPRQVINGNQTQRPTVSTSWSRLNRGFTVHQQQSVQQVSCVEKCISNNQLKEEFELLSRFLSKQIWIWCTHNFYPFASKFFKLKKVRSLKILMVVNIQTYAYGPSRALRIKHKPYVSNQIIALLQVSCYFHLPICWRDNSEIICFMKISAE